MCVRTQGLAKAGERNQAAQSDGDDDEDDSDVDDALLEEIDAFISKDDAALPTKKPSQVAALPAKKPSQVRVLSRK